jgi:hypothetical protein
MPAGCSPPPPLGHTDVGSADTALEVQVGGRFYSDGWGTGGYDVSADTALEEDTALEASVRSAQILTAPQRRCSVGMGCLPLTLILTTTL